MEQTSIIKDILRFPRLDTVLMVEKFIKEYDGEYKKRELWEHLPKKMMYQTFCVIIDYLLYSNKISIISLDSKNLYGVIIKSENIANTQRSIYELLWDLI